MTRTSRSLAFACSSEGHKMFCIHGKFCLPSASGYDTGHGIQEDLLESVWHRGKQSCSHGCCTKTEYGPVLLTRLWGIGVWKIRSQKELDGRFCLVLGEADSGGSFPKADSGESKAKKNWAIVYAQPVRHTTPPKPPTVQ